MLGLTCKVVNSPTC